MNVGTRQGGGIWTRSGAWGGENGANGTNGTNETNETNGANGAYEAYGAYGAYEWGYWAAVSWMPLRRASSLAGMRSWWRAGRVLRRALSTFST